MSTETQIRCPVCVTPLSIPHDSMHFRCPFCTTTLYVQYGFDGVTLSKEPPPSATPPPTEFEQLMAKALAPRPDPKVVWRGRLLGFKGRVSRGVYWVGFACGVLAYFSSNVFLGWARGGQPGGGTLVLALISLALSLASLWLWLAVSIKRYHDRNKTGWWVLIGLIPYIGMLVQVIELGFFPGTPGPNPYGEAG